MGGHGPIAPPKYAPATKTFLYRLVETALTADAERSFSIKSVLK